MALFGDHIGCCNYCLWLQLVLVPHQLLSGGVSGISMLLGYFTSLNLSIMYFVLNIPLLVAGWFILGRRFIILSIVSVAATSWFIGLLPVLSWQQTLCSAVCLAACS